MKVFVDSDVIIDFLTGRTPFGENAKLIFQLGQEKKLSLYTSPLILANANYIIGIMESKKVALIKIKRFCELIKVCPMSQSTVDRAVRSTFTDFEDALQNFCAEEANISILVTRNIKDFKRSNISIMKPEELISSINYSA